jgi:hypothetical protein
MMSDEVVNSEVVNGEWSMVKMRGVFNEGL